MRRLILALVAAFFFLLSPKGMTAQEPGPEHAPDFRAIERIEPLYFPPKRNAPFMAVARTLWVHTLPDGSTVTTQNQRFVARDMDGRIFQERRTFTPVPDDGKQESQISATQYSDPVEHTIYRCIPQQRVCNLFDFYDTISVPLVPAGLQPNRTTYLTREDLGTDTFAGLDVQRSREIYTHYAETIGNTKTILRTIEYWYSPALGVNVQVKRHDPRDGDQTLWLSDISPTDPGPDAFKIPPGYRIVDHRTSRSTVRAPEEPPL